MSNEATSALTAYLNDHFSMIKFNAYLWKMIVKAEYALLQTPAAGSSDASSVVEQLLSSPKPSQGGAVDEMKLHTQYLCQMTFCRGVDSFQTYLSGLLALIFEAKPTMLKSKKETVTHDFLLEHHAANDLISALAEKKVNDLTYHSITDLADFFEKSLHLPIFINNDGLKKAALYVEIRNLITHNRGIVNRIFQQRQPHFSAMLGTPILFGSDREVAEILGFLVYHARELDARAAAKYHLPTILPT